MNQIYTILMMQNGKILKMVYSIILPKEMVLTVL